MLGGCRNLVERSVNQSGQKGCVAERSVRHVKVFVSVSVLLVGLVVGVRRGGTLMRAEVVLRIVRERRCQSIAEGMEGKDCGRVER